MIIFMGIKAQVKLVKRNKKKNYFPKLSALQTFGQGGKKDVFGATNFRTLLRPKVCRAESFGD